MTQYYTDPDNGQTHEFPDDATPQEMSKALGLKYSAPDSTPEKIAGFLPHQAGLIANAAVKGATSLPTMIANIPAATANGVVNTYNYLSNGNASKVPYVDPFGRGADVVFGNNGQPQNAAERLEGDVLRPAFGVASGGVAGNSLASNGGILERAMASKLPLQYQAAIGGGASQGIARESGLSPDMQTAASLAGSLAVPSAVNIGKSIAGAVQPFTANGRDKIVGNILATYADNPQQAEQNIKNAPQLVSGSPVTAGTASGDYGLIGLEKSLGQEAPFSATMVAQNKARLDALNQAAGTLNDIATAKDARSAATKPLYDLSGAIPVNPAPIVPILAKIDQQVQSLGTNSEAGKELLAIKSKIQGALPVPSKSTPSINSMLGMQSSLPNNVNTIPSSQLVQVYKEIRDNLLKDSQQEGAYGSAVKGVIQPLHAELGQAIKQSNPIFAQAEDTFAQHSQPINQMENMQDIVKNIQGTQQDAEGNFFLSPAKAANIIKNGEVNTSRGWQPLNQALSPTQLDTLNNVQQDLARSNLVNNPAIKPPGSNTFNNMASANALNNATRGAINVGIPGTKWLYENANPQVKQNLIDTLQNPQKAATLIAAGTPNQENFLANLFGGLGIATGAGQVYNQ